MIILKYNLNTDFWGPIFWYVIHSSARVYTSDKKEQYKLFFKLLPKILPCNGCRIHCKSAYKEGYSPTEKDFQSSVTLFKYTYELHSYVNKCLKKKNPTFSHIDYFYKTSMSTKSEIDEKYGPVFWFMIHILAFSYSYEPSEKEKNNFINIFNLIKYIYPGTISKDYTFPINAFKNRESLIKFTYEYHNKINIKLNKKQSSFESYERFFKYKIVNLIDETPTYMGIYGYSSKKYKENKN